MHLERLRPIFAEPGPYLTLRVDIGRTSEHGAEQIESRWTGIRHHLEHASLSASLVLSLKERIHEKTHESGEACRTLVCAGDRILMDDVQIGHLPGREVIDIAELPDLAAWIEAEDRAIPFVLAVVDRTGGEVSAYAAASRPPVAEESVIGETMHITKVPDGDWAQKQFQQTAENRWHENAKLVAEAIRTAAFGSGTRTVLVAGEVRARAEVTKALLALDHGFSAIDVQSGGRAAGASTDALWAEVQERVGELVAAADADVAARLEEGVGHGAGAAVGVDDVLNALVKGQVDRLVVDPQGLADEIVEPARHPGLPLPAPADTARALPADRVLVAAATLTGADLTVLPASMSRGATASALLRWDDSGPG